MKCLFPILKQDIIQDGLTGHGIPVARPPEIFDTIKGEEISVVIVALATDPIGAGGLADGDDILPIEEPVHILEPMRPGARRVHKTRNRSANVNTAAVGIPARSGHDTRFTEHGAWAAGNLLRRGLPALGFGIILILLVSTEFSFIRSVDCRP